MITLIDHREEIVKKLALKYNMTHKQVEEIVMYQYKFMLNTMQSGSFKPIMLTHIGKWYPSKKRKQYWESKLKLDAENKGDISGV